MYPLSVKQTYFAVFNSSASSAAKNLSLIILSVTSAAKHISNTKNNEEKCKVKRSSPKLSLANKLILYTSTMVPTLIFSSVCWLNNVTNTKSLENVQKRCTKWISSDWKSNYKQLLLKCRFLPLSLYLQLQDILFLTKCMNGGFEYNFYKYLCFRGHPSLLRSNNCLTKFFSPRRCL